MTLFRCSEYPETPSIWKNKIYDLTAFRHFIYTANLNIGVMRRGLSFLY